MAKKKWRNQQPELYELIGAFLHAIIHAEGLAAKATIDFISEVGFDHIRPKGNNLDLGELRMVTFEYHRPNNTGRMEKVTIHVPLLSLVPIPILQIQEAEVDFCVDIIDIIRTAYREEGDESKKVKMLARMAEARPEKEEVKKPECTRIKIKMTASDIPTGLKHLFNLMDHAVYSQEKLDKR